MQIDNIHERELNASIVQVGELIDSLSSKADRLWPSHTWPRMQFDRPLGIGADGGHGPIRYYVEDYSEGQYIKFRFTGPSGFDGYHAFTIIEQSGGSVKLRHAVKMNTLGIALLSWPLIFGPLHDALLEDALTKAEISLGLPPTLVPWSLRVRLLRWVLTGGKAPTQARPATD